MRRVDLSILAAALLTLGGCAAPPAVAPTTAPVTRPVMVARPATEPVKLDPNALLALGQIQPAVTLATPATQPTDPPSLEALQLFAKSHAALLDEDLPASIALLQQAIKLDPQSFQLHYTLAREYQGESNTNDNSIAELKRSAEIEPDHLPVYVSLGRQYLAKNDPGAALQYLRLALQTTDYQTDEPRTSIADFFLASALARLGYDQAALDAYQGLATRLREPSMALRNNAEAATLLGHIDALDFEIADLLQKLGRYELAATAYHDAAGRDPGNFELRSRECHCLLWSGKSDEAVRAAADCIVQFNASPQSIALLREVLKSQDQDTDAIGAVASLYRRHPNQPALLYALTDLMRDAGRISEADRLLTDAQASRPRDVAILARRVEIRRSRMQLDAAAKLIIEASSAYPDLSAELSPLWSRLNRPSAVGRITLSSVKAIALASAREACRLYWLSQSARSWHRDAIARRTMEEATALKPAFAPAFRDLFDMVWADSDVDVPAKVEATNQLSKRAKLAGDKALAIELAGMSQLKQNEPAKAAAVLKEAIDAGSKAPELLLELATALLQSGDTAGFESLLWKLINDRPMLAEPYLTLYAHYVVAESEAQSQRVLATWAANDPHNATGQEIRARDYLRNGRLQAAEPLFQRLLVENADDSEVLESTGVFYAQTNHLPEFVQKLEDLRAHDAKNLAVSLALADTYTAQGNTIEASNAIDSSRAQFDKDPDALYLISGAYSRLGQKETNEQVLDALLKLDPTHAGACNDLGYLLAEEGKNLPKAESLIRQAITLEPHNSSFLDSMGWVLYKLGRFAEARGFLDRAVGPLDADAAALPDPVLLDHRGDVLYRLGQTQAAGADWQRAADRITSLQSERNDLKDLRLQLLEKQKQLSAGQPVHVAPAKVER